MTAWRVEQRSQSSKRPPTSVILDQLKEDVHLWGKSIISPTSIQPRNSRKRPTYWEVVWLTHDSMQWKALTQSPVGPKVTVGFIRDRISYAYAEITTKYPRTL